MRIAVKRTGEKELSLIDTQTNRVKKKLKAEDYRIYSRFSRDGTKLIVSGYGQFTFLDLSTGDTRNIDEFSRTGSTIDLSKDGSLFAEGGSWGNASIRIAETKTGKSRLIGGRSSGRIQGAYQASELEVRLISEKQERQILINEAKAQRDKQAAVDTVLFKKQVYIAFEHYGNMRDPREQRMLESAESNMSKKKTSATDANAVWLRLKNNSPLPIKIPTQSMYLPNPKCYYEFTNGKKIFGLCDNREIAVWHGLEDAKGKPVRYGFDFGSDAFLLPEKSVLFAVPREILKNGYVIRFGFTFQKETEKS